MKIDWMLHLQQKVQKMKNISSYKKLLQKNALFRGFSEEDMERMLGCLSTRVCSYSKKEVIFHQGEKVLNIGIIISGGVQIVREDVEGNMDVITNLGVNDIFAEVFMFARIEESPVTVQATLDSEILWINYHKIAKTCQNACGFHKEFIENMLALIANKNIALNRKNEILAKRTTRSKVLTFLNQYSQMFHSDQFKIPYNREELSNYLCVDRSALSRELCTLREEGIIQFHKNEFALLRKRHSL